MAITQPDGLVEDLLVKGPTPHSVWVKQFWSDDWIFVQYLDCIQAKEAAPPTLGSAQFLWRYGLIDQFEDADYVRHDPFWLMDWYVQLRTHSSFGESALWTGQIQRDALDMWAINTDAGITPGNQTLGAFSLEYILQRRRIDATYVEGGTVAVDRREVFNRPFKVGLAIMGGNRSASRNGDGVYTFSTDGFDWSVIDIIQYILNYFQPAAIPFVITGQTSILNQIVGETFDLWGMTPFDAFNKLINRRRGVGWRVITTGSGNSELNVYSLASEQVSFGEFSLPANSNQVSLVFDDLIDMEPQLSIDRGDMVDTIHVVGEPVKTMFSVSIRNATLEEGWTVPEQTSYEESTDEERKTDKYLRVFQFLRVPNGWDHTFDGLDGFGAEFVNPLVLDDGTVDLTQQDSHWSGSEVFRHFEDQLPVQVEATIDDAAPEYLKPFLLGENPDVTDEYHHVEKLDVVELEEYSLRMSDRELGLSTEGKINHLLGLNNFTAIEETEIDEEIDYTRLIGTIFMAQDTNIRVLYKLPTNSASEAGRTLLIPVQGAEFWWQAGGTVLGVTDGVLQFGPVEGAVLRDDSARLRAIANAAAVWYGSQKATLSYVHKGIATFHRVGTMIRNAATTAFIFEQIGTTVTSRTWHFGETMTTTIQTGYSELDTQLLVGTGK